MRAAVVLVALASFLFACLTSFGAGGEPTASPIYRLWLDGRRTALSASAPDIEDMVVSPDGRRVAYVRDTIRNGGRIYVANTDGRGTSRWSRSLYADQAFEHSLAWSPDSRRLVAAAGSCSLPRCRSTVYVLAPDAAPRVIARGNTMWFPSWSPSGRLITVEEADKGVRAFTPNGRALWRVDGLFWGDSGSWSHRGFLVVRASTRGENRDGRTWRARIYDERGRLRAALHARGAGWSPRGDRLAVLVQNRLEIHNSRGRTLFTRRVPALENASRPLVGTLTWLGEDRVIVPRGSRSDVVNVRTGEINTGSTGKLLGALSPDRRFVATYVYGHGRRGVPTAVALRITPLNSRRRQVRSPFAPCANGLHWVDIDWLPGGRSLVYHLGC